MKSIALTLSLALSLFFGALMGQAASFAAGPTPPQQSSISGTTIPRDVRVVLHLVDEKGRVTSYDNFARNASSRRGQFPGAIFNDGDADHRFILFDDVKWISELSENLRAELMDKFNSGQWIIGIKGSDPALKSAMGLLPAELQEVVPSSTADLGTAVFLYRNPAGILNELVIDAPTDRNFRSKGPNNTLTTAFGFLRDWHLRQKHAVQDGDDPWNAIQNWERSGTTIGYFGGNEFFPNQKETVGTYRYTLSPYWLDSDDNGKDWYRVDYQMYSEISNYVMTGDSFGDTSGTCGWWTTGIVAGADILTTNGEWWEFMPSTTVGSTSTSFTIGGDISTSGAGVSGAYSKSYGTSDVTITVDANTVDQAIGWRAELTGCGDYDAYPFYSGASNAAKTTYNLNPSLIIDIPQGAVLKFQTSIPSGPDEGEWRFQVEKDEIYCGSACLTIDWTSYRQEYYRNESVSCTKTGCTFTAQ